MQLLNNIYIWNTIDNKKKQLLLLRPILRTKKEIQKTVKTILNDIKYFGDTSLYKYTFLLDKQKIKKVQIDKRKLHTSIIDIEEDLKKSILLAKSNIEKFHIEQKNKDIDIETKKGIRCQKITTPINSIGLYIPGGNTPLISTVLMLSIPAYIAKCKNVYLCSPPPISKEILYSAQICGIKNIFQMGGAQAIAAFAFGTNQVPKVNKIFGPGNSYVTEAKRQVKNLIPNLEIDMLAGPSELMIIADEFANSDFVAWDLLSQAEHGPDSQVILLSYSLVLIKNVINKINEEIKKSFRKKILTCSIKNSRFIVVNNIDEAIKISNLYAPEHLILNILNPRSFLAKIKNAGSVFLGPWSPESVGDYSSGTNHVLPTYGSAIVNSGLGLSDFQKYITIQELTPSGFLKIYNSVTVLSSYEKLEAHKNAMKCRFKYLMKGKNNV
ncbi:histidinol dehydrogenase [Buchnera aphidicola]|uniref:Histidinol dehydrogenase n=1 Tax=Buchnera aphidicola (Anoecia oenotherae) TaxID=1241833 RepID=A0A4D6XUQ0_9GAMM|nr:histidinol dehydrogenase [Buchnera aphidicola]QCI19219.1 histidinol dehydrogenase [Buchnera aphidicola (Anoecia oenotherae)]